MWQLKCSGKLKFDILKLTFIVQCVLANIWSWASNSGGYDVEAMVKATKGTTNLNPEVRDKTIAYLVAQMDRLLGYRRPIDRKVIKMALIQLKFCTSLTCYSIE